MNDWVGLIDGTARAATVVADLSVALAKESDPIDAVESALECLIEGEQSFLDLVFRDLVSCYERLREAIARDWSCRLEPIENLHAHMSSELPRLRAVILAALPAYIKGVRRLLAESETANVVWLPPYRSP